MIDAIKAIKLMPSTQRRIRQQEDRLEEISRRIAEAAREDRSSITIFVYDYEEYYISKILKDQGFQVDRIPHTLQFNNNEYRFKCLVSWK